MRTCIWLLAVLLLPQAAQAHDYWIESQLLSVAGQQRLKSRLYLGGGMKAEEEQPHKPERAASFHLYLPDRSIDLSPLSPKARTPMLEIPFKAQAGLLRLDRNPAYLVSTPAEFRHNLEHENQLKGFGFLLPAQTVRERYTRYIKSLIGSGVDLHARHTGQRLEIMLLDNPIATKPGGVVRVRVQFEGKALAGAPLIAYRRDARGALTTQTLRTDVGGQARLKLDGAGFWLLRMMHLRPCVQDCADVQWESFWAAYSFRR